MSNVFGIASQAALGSAHSRLQAVALRVLRIKDHSVLKGHRPESEQNAAYYGKPQRSKLKWPDGKHNGLPSKAIDVQTYPLPAVIDENKCNALRARFLRDEYEQVLREEQLYLLGLYVGVAFQMGITLRTGADWDRDGEIADNGFDDFYHVEIVECSPDY